ncbi:MAG: carbohydrate ABC transporter permease [Spirochaetes bacterium]|nr:carbohydrate ABC transporter permease [Spirochaetota bacterium]
MKQSEGTQAPADAKIIKIINPKFWALSLAGITFKHLALTCLAVLVALPFIWMVLTSLKPLGEVGLPEWIPSAWQWNNYGEVFKVINYGQFYLNSIFVACWVTFLQVFTSSLAAFSFSRLQWKLRDRLFVLYLGTMMLPGIVMMIPNYQIMIKLGLVDSYLGLILPGAFSTFGTFLLRQFMLSIPRSLDEAAEIDGCGPWQLFWEIVLPLARPGLIALTIFTFIGNYQSFFWPLVMLKSVDKFTLPIGLLFFDSTRGQVTHLLMAAVTMSIVPMILIFVLLQKYMVKGIFLGGVKG